MRIALILHLRRQHRAGSARRLVSSSGTTRMPIIVLFLPRADRTGRLHPRASARHLERMGSLLLALRHGECAAALVGGSRFFRESSTTSTPSTAIMSGDR